MKVLLLLCVLAILWSAKECHSLTQFNYEGSVQELQSLNRVVLQEKLKAKNPLLIHNVKLPQPSLSEICEAHPGYMIREGETYKLLDTCLRQDLAIYENQGLYRDLGYEKELTDVSEPFETSMACRRQGFLSLYRGFHAIDRVKCLHNVNLIAVLASSAILYLINPKHASEIEALSNASLKKWSHRVILKPGSVLSIPTEWSYFYECKGETLIYTYRSDTYGTCLYNMSR